MMKLSSKQVCAVMGLAELHPDMWVMNGERFTCSEAEAIAEFLDAFGPYGDDFRASHAQGDDDVDDLHEPVMGVDGCLTRGWKLREGTD